MQMHWMHFANAGAGQFLGWWH